MRNQKGYVAGHNRQAVVTAQQVIACAMLSQHLVGGTFLDACAWLAVTANTAESGWL